LFYSSAGLRSTAWSWADSLLAFSRLIDNSVVVLENIFRHLEMGQPALVAAETGGKEVALPVLASTLTTAVVFFPVTLLAGVSKFLFSAMALAVVIHDMKSKRLRQRQTGVAQIQNCTKKPPIHTDLSDLAAPWLLSSSIGSTQFLDHGVQGRETNPETI
jgi:hypothetical protein